ncbi:TniB family NTP-binding protein [Caballeronia sp. NCTM1]|uniref:TniB family NTP-binding protein n=1 Tax=Caballeronia sp. NCTM1 TaxID=2921753 RepID=UPI00202777D2
MTPAQQLRRDIETCELPHPMFETLRMAIKQRIDDTLEGFAPKIVRVPGPSGAGKSSLITNLMRDYPVTRINGRLHAPVLSVKLKQGVSPKELPKRVLDALGIRMLPRSMTAGALFDLMLEQLKLAGTRVVIFDETSELVDDGSRVPPRAASDWFKSLADSLDGMLILFGIPRLERLFAANEQLRRRACPPLKFLPYNASDSQEMTAYHACVANYARLFAAAGYPVEMPLRVLTQQTYLLTGGLVGVLADFMKELASRLAHEAPRPVTYADCTLVAREHVSHAGSPHYLSFLDGGLESNVEPAALRQAYVHVLNNNAEAVPVRRKKTAGDER